MTIRGHNLGCDRARILLVGFVAEPKAPSYAWYGEIATAPVDAAGEMVWTGRLGPRLAPVSPEDPPYTLSDPTRFYRIGIQGCAAEVDPYRSETKLVLCGYLSPRPTPSAD